VGQTLERCENMFGPISADITCQIKRYLHEPTVANWDDIYGIIINPKGMMTTIWQAVMAIDPDFPQVGPSEDLAGNRLSEWEYIPTPFQLLQAIKKATERDE
jgi:hypothetical protein